ncbi:hypothetical protein HME7025_00247 [Aquirufa nivalisilvae]|uniref:Phage abortive infection protein n=1 Tax=Aquirufa nivalisilvae TaxID=2516557 RepID=A0A2S2DSW9_9BACT|nr:hypothetical protein [Aquirufa nivalisilvae]AWL08130.1 hypothetical protein HME7025_00247 [Aquirufa nivalisilvae]MCZ2479381.1 hypothetical protein [Aquirufa nivalisilvae]
MLNKKLNTTFIIASMAILIFLVIITFKLITETDNPALFTIDFDEKSHVVSSYGTLVGSLLTFLSIIFVIYTILQQKEQYSNDKLLEKSKEKNALFDRLKLIHNLLNEIFKHITDTGVEMKAFFEIEKEKTFGSNQMSFYTNKNYYRLLELDYQSIFSAFQEYSKDEDKTKSFNDLYKMVDFYSESFIEQREKYLYHINDKVERKQKIASELNSVMDEASKMIGEYKIELATNNEYKQNLWFQLLNELIVFYYKLISEKDDADFEAIEKEVLVIFLKKANAVEKNIGFEKRILDLVLKIAGIRKQLNSMKMESLNFSNQIESRYKKYYAPESKNLMRLNELSTNISGLITNSVKPVSKNRYFSLL